MLIQVWSCLEVLMCSYFLLSNGICSEWLISLSRSKVSDVGISTSNFCAIRFVSVLNSIFVKKSNNFSGTGALNSRSSSSNFNGVLQSSVTNSLDILICSSLSMSACRLLGCLISPDRRSNSSRSPNSLIKVAAVLMPMPGAPGTLSTLSPASA